MEYVFVTGPKNRQVLIDGRVAGATNSIIVVEAGTHEFSLDAADDNPPQSKLAIVANTTSATPKQINLKTA